MKADPKPGRAKAGSNTERKQLIIFGTMGFHYAYILVSESDPDRYYTGHTDDLKARLAAHNAGECEYTSPFRPWRFKTAVAFTDPARGIAFERYLKTRSGRAFAKKRL